MTWRQTPCKPAGSRSADSHARKLVLSPAAEKACCRRGSTCRRGRRLPARHPAPPAGGPDRAGQRRCRPPQRAVVARRPGHPVRRRGQPRRRVRAGPTLDWLTTRFTGCTSLEYEIVAAGISGDPACLAAIERISASANGDPASYALRATTIFRREGSVEGHSPPRRPVPAGLGDLGASACSRWTWWRFRLAGVEAGDRLGGGACDLTTAPPPRAAGVWHHTAPGTCVDCPERERRDRKWPQSRAETWAPAGCRG